MAEFETRKPHERCWSCRYYVEDISLSGSTTGWCKRRPRLHQKHDDKTHRTNWCQYYEVNPTMAKIDNRGNDIVGEAHEQLDPGPQRTQYGDAEMVNASPPPSYDEVNGRLLEAMTMHAAIKNLHAQAQQAVVDSATANDNASMFQSKGSILTLHVIEHGIEQRIQELTKEVEEAKQRRAMQ